MVTAFSMMQPQFWTIEQLAEVAKASGYFTEDWLACRFQQSTDKNMIFVISYLDPDAPNGQDTGCVYVTIDEDLNLALDF